MQFIALLLVILSFALAPAAASADNTRQKAESLVRQATETIGFFSSDDHYDGLWKQAARAKAIIVIPENIKAGFLFGGSGGTAVMIARNDDGSWSGPTFLSVGSFSFGLQAGGQVSEIVLLAMTNRGKERLLSTSAKLGADVSIAAGPLGGGAEVKTADILAYARSRGLYGGLTVEGSVLDVKTKWNRAYYGADISAYDVVYRGVEDNPASLPLRRAAARLSSRWDSRDRPVTSARDEQQYPEATTIDPPPGRVYDRPGDVEAVPLDQPAGEPYRAPGTTEPEGGVPGAVRSDSTVPGNPGSAAPRRRVIDPAYRDPDASIYRDGYAPADPYQERYRDPYANPSRNPYAVQRSGDPYYLEGETPVIRDANGDPIGEDDAVFGAPIKRSPDDEPGN